MLLQKNLLAERAKELTQLKKELKKKKQTVAKKQEQQLQRMWRDEIAAEQKQLAAVSVGDSEADAAHGHLLSGEIDKYKSLIMQAISSNWIVPEGVVKGDFCQLLVNVAPGGVVLEVKLLKSSGNEFLNRSAEAAILKASPLPVPEDSKLFDSVRVIKPTFRPEGIE